LRGGSSGPRPGSTGTFCVNRHCLKNGHPAHVFTPEDTRKAADVTNQIRREKRALLEQLRLNREMEQMLATNTARRKRRAEKQRRRRQELTEK
jgi:hypothetical protein